MHLCGGVPGLFFGAASLSVSNAAVAVCGTVAAVGVAVGVAAGIAAAEPAA